MTNEMTISKETRRMLKLGEQKSRKRATSALVALTTNRYFDGLPISEVIDILKAENFDVENLYGIYCGGVGRIHEQVGPSTWIVLSWYRMDSGRYEVVAYLS